ncbi:alkyl hydroperoxide reductase subunit c/ thiol specific antioxidant [Lucifera butyrica]|uniref:Alkyl hydroperoxide reductase subunit c/ thiol specific antioxidant n=1 Tax=Lucifera butyrica TaxID=1351585 RepID=A0A498R979_9FIRM|nr:tetratricopeptide repeat protein [Lucifera butyrica]VBB05688.1 alkyl hydroperoxide reductase subunit c/ thiol specific antioxidant [Lucifera butyrica]
MNFFSLLRKYLCLFVLAIIMILGQKLSYAMSPGEAVPNVNDSAMVRPGEIAKDLNLPNLDGEIVHIDFKGKPTILVSLGLESNVEKMIEWQSFYNSHKNDINFYLLAHQGKERMQKIIKQQNFDMPILLDDKISFVRKYNNAVPALFITDKDGVVVYNSEMAIEMDSLNAFLDKLLKEGKHDLPSLRFAPLKRPVPPPPPPFMNNGTVIKQEIFGTMDGQDFLVKYNSKPTVLLFWADFNLDQTLGKELNILQKAYEDMNDKANFYTVNFSNHKMARKILDRHQSTVPALIDKNGVYLQYSRAFPSIIIIDKNGVIRYRPDAISTAEALEKLIESCDVPYVPLPVPQTAEEWVKRGDELYKDKNYFYTEAIDAYSQAIRLNPNYYVAYLKRARLYDEKYNDQKALEDLDKMIELKPDVIDSYYLRASVLIKLRRFDLAINDYDKILDIKPDELQASLDRAGVYKMQGKYDLAINEYSKLIESAPKGKAIAIYMNRGDCYLFSNKNDLAISDYSQVLELNPLFQYALANRGLAFLQQKDYDRAIADFTKAIELNPVEKYYEDRSIAYLRQQKVDLAIEDLTKIINMNPNYRYTYFYRGLLFVKEQQYTKAVADFIAEKEQYPRNGYLLFALAQALELSGEREQSLENYKEAVEFLPPKATNKLIKAQKRVDGDWESYKEWID